eukprot:15484535-Alexandrium_andersonii.AAC.2
MFAALRLCLDFPRAKDVVDISILLVHPSRTGHQALRAVMPSQQPLCRCNSEQCACPRTLSTLSPVPRRLPGASSRSRGRPKEMAAALGSGRYRMQESQRRSG